jgi:DNA polymerase-1
VIEFDVETDGLQWYAGDRPFLAQFYDGAYKQDVDGPALFEIPAASRHVQDWLVGRPSDGTSAGGYRAWNSKFDLHFLKAAGFDLPPESTWHDGMVLAHIMDERFSVALQARGDRLFPGDAGAETEKAVKDWLAAEARRRQASAKLDGTEYTRPNYGDVPRDIMRSYAAHDVLLQRRVCDVYEPALDRVEGFRELYEMERGVLRALFAAERRGIHFDRDRLVRLEGSLMPQLDAEEDRCRRIAEFKNFNPRSPKQVSEALDRLGADTRYMTRDADTKQLTVDEENLTACDHELAAAVLDYRGVHKLWSMVHRIGHGKPEDRLFPKPYLTDEDLVHPSFNQVGARTGRMSCSNPNFQQINRDDLRLRHCVTARPGKKLVCVDLDGIELRLLAAFAGEGALLDLLRSGQDPHQHTADMLGFTGRRRSGGSFEDPRNQGKKYNYLKNYGGGLRATRKWFHCSIDEARAYRARYEAAYPEVKALEERIEIALEDQGYIRTPWGRRHRIKRSAEQEAYMFIANLCQGTAADLFKDSLVKVHDAGVPIIACVHDELIAEVDAADAPEAGAMMVEALTDHPRITQKVPVTAEAKIVDSWAQAKDPNYVPEHEAA